MDPSPRRVTFRYDMDVCTAVGNDIKTLLSKYSSSSECHKALQKCSETIEEAQALQQQLRDATEMSEELREQVASVLSDIQTAITQTSVEHRGCHYFISKLGKSIDRHFVTEFAKSTDENVFKGANSKLLDRAICEHFLRQGRVGVAENLIKEAGLELVLDQEPFMRMNAVVEAFHRRDVGPALEWAVEHREQLQAQGSILEFKLHRLRFIQLLTEGPGCIPEALRYARNLGSFSAVNQKEVQRLMSCFLYQHNLKRSPYADLQDTAHWNDARNTFAHDACMLQGLSVDSPLAVCIAAGCKALPALINIRHLVEKRLGTFSEQDELPVEIDLGPQCNFHSLFACPILRQQTTDSNPPFRLLCGHVISHDAMNKLVRGIRLKCPYCPMDMVASDPREVYF